MDGANNWKSPIRYKWVLLSIVTKNSNAATDINVEILVAVVLLTLMKTTASSPYCGRKQVRRIQSISADSKVCISTFEYVLKNCTNYCSARALLYS